VFQDEDLPTNVFSKVRLGDEIDVGERMHVAKPHKPKVWKSKR